MALGLLVSGCISAAKEREVYGALRDVGFTEADARCVGRRAGRQLSIAQLRSLQRAASTLPQPVKEQAVGDVIEAIRSNVDGETLGAVARLGTECVRLRMEGRAG